MRCLQAPGVVSTSGFRLCERCVQEVKEAIARELIEAGAPPRARYGERLLQVHELVQRHGFATSALLSVAAKISRSQASTYLHTQAKQGWLEFKGKGRFELAEASPSAPPAGSGLAEARKKWAKLFDQVWGSASDMLGMFVVDQGFTVVALNESYRRVYGYGVAEAVAMTDERRVRVSENRDTLDEVTARLQTDEYVQCTIRRLQDHAGREINVEAHYYVVERVPEIIVFVHGRRVDPG